jgi:hypothetical protein
VRRSKARASNAASGSELEARGEGAGAIDGAPPLPPPQAVNHNAARADAARHWYLVLLLEVTTSFLGMAAALARP